MKHLLSLRPATPADVDFLHRVYAETRTEELSVVDWSEAEKAAFLKMQFEAQHTYYHQQFPDAAFDVVLLEGKPIGRLYVDRRADEIRIIDIALLPAYRGRGLGAKLMRDVLAEAARQGLYVRIHVEHTNTARRLYDRLGFTQVADQGVYVLMAWAPPKLASSSQEKTAAVQAQG